MTLVYEALHHLYNLIAASHCLYKKNCSMVGKAGPVVQQQQTGPHFAARANTPR